MCNSDRFSSASALLALLTRSLVDVCVGDICQEFSPGLLQWHCYEPLQINYNHWETIQRNLHSIFNLDGLIDDLIELNTDMDVEIDKGVKDELQEIHQLHIPSETERVAVGCPYFLAPCVIEKVMFFEYRLLKTLQLCENNSLGSNSIWNKVSL